MMKAGAYLDEHRIGIRAKGIQRLPDSMAQAS
jgi:hypothetical protein